MPRKEDSLAHWRSEIDQVDQEILQLLNRRARCVGEVGRIKASAEGAVYVASRELDVLDRIERSNPGPLPGPAVRGVFREVISASRALQRDLRISYLGPPATYTHEAAAYQFGHAAQYAPAGSIREIFSAVEEGRADFGVIPVESSVAGLMSQVYDRLLETPLSVSAEVRLSIHHDLLSKSGELGRVRAVYSHPLALDHCQKWLDENLPHAAAHATSTTARAAQFAAVDENAAAIASSAAAGIYELQVISSRIEENPMTSFRFWVMGSEPSKPSSRDLTAVLFATEPGEVGSLHGAVGCFANHGLNISRFESCSAGPWRRLYGLECSGHVEEEPMAQALADLRQRSPFVRVLGSFARVDRPHDDAKD